MPHVLVGKWGNNLAVRFPGEIALTSGLAEGDQVDIVASADEIVIRRAEPRFTLAGLFAGNTDAHWRAQYAGAFDWGPDTGREIVAD